MGYPRLDRPSALEIAQSEPDTTLTQMAGRLAAMSTWIDQHPPNAERDPEAQLWSRTAKVGEEFGEVVAEIISLTGQNPRKEQDPEAAWRVVKELLDVALTALAAVEHMTGNTGSSVGKLAVHIANVVQRAGLE
jgi:hypothetical protein